MDVFQWWLEWLGGGWSGWRWMPAWLVREQRVGGRGVFLSPCLPDICQPHGTQTHTTLGMSHRRRQIEAARKENEATLKREVAEVQAAAQQQQWEQRRQLVDEAADAAREHQAALQELRGQLQVSQSVSSSCCRSVSQSVSHHHHHQRRRRRQRQTDQPERTAQREEEQGSRAARRALYLLSARAAVSSAAVSPPPRYSD